MYTRHAAAARHPQQLLFLLRRRLATGIAARPSSSSVPTSSSSSAAPAAAAALLRPYPHQQHHPELLQLQQIQGQQRRAFADATAGGGSSSSAPPSSPPPPSPPQPPAAGAGAGGGGSQPPPAPAANASIVELNEQNLEAVIARSPVPVILDCYADWCEPCKKLTPVLEKLVAKYQGRLILAKLNADKYQEVAMSLQVRSLPSVFGIHEGKLVDRFVGMPSEQMLAAFMERLLSLSPPGGAAQQQPQADAAAGGGDPAEAGPEVVLAEADALAAQDGKAQEAGALYKKVYEELSREETPPKYLQARCLAGLGKCALAGGHAAEAGQIVGMLKKQHEAEIKTIPEVAAAVSFLETALQAPAGAEGEGAGDTLKRLEDKVKADPTDLEARHALALKFFQLQKFERAMDEALEILKRDKAWNDGAARGLLLKVFEALGPGSELAKKGRARMTNYLFL